MIPLLYALVTSFATVTGGALPMYTRLRFLEQRYMVAFAGGAMVAIALFDLIPEMDSHNAVALLAGFFIVYLLEKLVMIHTCGEAECDAHTMGWSALIGIAAESLIDGVAIAVGFRAAPALGLLIALAVFVHEVPRGLTTTVIMQEAGYSRIKVWAALAVDAGFAPLGRNFVVAGFGGRLTEEKREAVWAIEYPFWEAEFSFDFLHRLDQDCILLFHTPPAGTDLDLHRGRLFHETD